MSSKADDPVPASQPSGEGSGGSSTQLKPSNATRGAKRGLRGGARGRGRGGRTPSIGGGADMSASSPASLPADEKPKPSLLSRMDSKPTAPISPINTKDRLAKLATVSTQASPVSPSEAASPKSRPQRKKRPNGTNPLTLNVVSPSSPGQKTAILITTPLSAKGKSPLSQITKSEAPSLAAVSEGLAPSNGPESNQAASTPVPEPPVELKLPASPIPSSRSFTPQYRDWAAEDDEDENGSLPSLDDWGLPGVKAASEAGDNISQSRSTNSLTASSLAKLSMTDDSDNAGRGRRSGSAPPPVSSPKVPSFAGVIPPTPVATTISGQGRSIKGAAAAAANRFASVAPEAADNASLPRPLNRAELTFSRSNSPRPLNLVRRDSVTSMSGLSPRPLSPAYPEGASRSSSPRPTSGGVALGSRPSSPAPNSPSFNVLELRRPDSPGFHGSRPGSPAMSFTGSRPSSPAHPKTGVLSGGVSLGPSRSGSPNPSRAGSPRPNQATFLQPSATSETPADWRKPPTPRLNTQPLQESPIPPPLDEEINPQPTPVGGSLALRMSDPPLVIPPFQGNRGGMRGRNFRGRLGRGGFLGPSHPLAQVQGPASPASPSTPRGRGGSFASLRGSARGERDSATASPTTPSSPGERSNRGHARTGSGTRPVISSLAISRIGQSLNSPSKPKPSPSVES